MRLTDMPRLRLLLLLPAAFLGLAATDLPETAPLPEPAPRADAAPAADHEDEAGDADAEKEDADQKDAEKEEDGKAADAGEQAPPPDPAPPPADEEALAACERSLEALGATFERRPAIDGPGECGLSATYAVTEIARGVSIAPETQMTCETALATARWVRQVVIPAARVLGDDVRLTGIRQASTYVCRNRNGRADTKISEHAAGAAIDIAAFEFDGHEPLPIVPEPRRGSLEKAFQRAVRGGACIHFTTVLGPGADAYHDDHIHLDIAKRRGGFRLCQ